MKRPSISARTLALRLLLLTIVIAVAAFAFAQSSAKPTDDIPASSQMQTADLVQAMKSAQNPVVLYVGPKAFYTQAHIPGAEFIGPVGKPEGTALYTSRFGETTPKDTSRQTAEAQLIAAGHHGDTVLYVRRGPVAATSGNQIPRDGAVLADLLYRLRNGPGPGARERRS